MQLKCTKCQRVINIDEKKLPADKEKAMVKCPGCQQVLVFAIPGVLRKTIPQAEKTIITSETVSQALKLPRLHRADNNTTFELKPGKNILGRDADISIDGDRYISRKHCLIEVVARGNSYQCILTDDGSISDSGQPSTNGTFHNEVRLTALDKIYLSPGDTIRVGRTTLNFLFD